MKQNIKHFELFTAEAWRKGNPSLSQHSTEQEAWQAAKDRVLSNPVKPLYSVWCHAHADYRVAAIS